MVPLNFWPLMLLHTNCWNYICSLRFICFVILCLWVLCLYRCIFTPCVLMPMDVRRKYTFFITRVVDVCELPCGCWEPNSARTASTFNCWAILPWESITKWMILNKINSSFKVLEARSWKVMVFIKLCSVWGYRNDSFFAFS